MTSRTVSGQRRLPARPDGVGLVRETAAGTYPLYCNPEWQARFPWLVQGTTGRGDDGLDLGLFGAVPTGVAQARWRRLREVAGVPAAVHARQVHEARLLWHEHAPSHPGLVVCDDADAHATTAPGLLLTVSVADCTPVFLVAPERRAIALMHAGWRGVGAGVVEAGVAALAGRAGAQPSDLFLHCGPSICGECYEVGPEVPAALVVDAPADEKVRLDVRAVIARRAIAAGIPAAQVSVSEHCTGCGEQLFWSHRGGCRERQMGVMAIRP